MVLKPEIIAGNIAAMSAFCQNANVLLAPHAKTAMSPEITALQMDAGAWAMTAATPHQVRVLHAFGVQRILLANVLVDLPAIAWVRDHVLSDPSKDFLCYVDSLAGLERLENALAGSGHQRLGVLIELGYRRGRTGCRTIDEALTLARAVSRSDAVWLAGIAGFEGLIRGSSENAPISEVDAFLDHMHDCLVALHDDGLFPVEPPIVSAGGSSHFQRVVEKLGPTAFPLAVRTVLRSGCYVSHDHGLYAETSPLSWSLTNPTGLRAALELLCSVWSRPEPDLIIAGFGRRDAPTDDRMPVVLRNHSAPQSDDMAGYEVVGVNDQHAFIRVPAHSLVGVGDVLGLGVSHPCGAFDRWRFLPLVTPDYDVVGGVTTYL
ncbi:alanine racemase [Agromyces italicus]|uniref:alanine racemase n=1 Tax=Agromyces italicus TaxID=279572 RepID=UPI0006872A5D